MQAMILRGLFLLVLLIATAVAEEARHWTVFCAPPLKAALEPLAEHRRAQGYQVELVDATDGYLEKAEAAKDIIILAGALDEKGGGRADCILPGGTGTIARMKGRPSDGVLAADGKIIGRLPAATPEEMGAMVAKIIRFEKEGAAADRGMGCIIGNPLPGREHSKVVDLMLGLQIKSTLSGVNRAWRIGGAADLFWKPLPQASPDFPAVMGSWMEGTWEVLAYFGHSGDTGIYSSGTTYGWPDLWSNPTGPPRGLFFTCGCHAMAHEGAYAVQAMRAPSGPAAVIGASAISYSTIGYLAGKGLAACASDPEGPATVGEWWLLIRSAIEKEPMSTLRFTVFDYLDGSNGTSPLAEQRKEHLEMWSLLGDPAMRMPRK